MMPFLVSFCNNLPAIIFAYWSGYLCSQGIDGWGWMLVGSLFTVTTTRIFSQNYKENDTAQSGS